MKKIITTLKRIFTLKHIERTFAIIGVFSVLSLSVYGICKANIKPEPEKAPELIDVRALKSQLLESSELTTAKLYLTDYAEYKDTGTPIINKSDFVMIFDATVRAGINLEDVEIPEDEIDYINKIIYVKIPKATLQDEPAVDPSNIKYFDEQFALFPTKLKEDANYAQVLAQEKAKEQALQSGILEMADKQSEALVIGLLSKASAAHGYTFEVLKEA